MSTPSPQAYQWLKKLPSALLQLDDIPLLGFPPQFPWDSLAQNLSQLLEIKDLKIFPKEIKWRTAEELYSGLDHTLVAKNISVAPLSGSVCWVMPQEALRIFTAQLIEKRNPDSEQYDESFQEGLYQFLTVEVLHSLGQINFDNHLSYQLLPEAELPSEPALCLEVQITLSQTTLYGRLLISPEFRQSWKERYANRKLDFPLDDSLINRVTVPVHLDAGQVVLTEEEWEKLQPGDFLVLDSCSLQADGKKGRVMLTVNQRPFLRGRVKEGVLKILEFPSYEVGDTMAEESPEEEKFSEEPELEEEADEEESDEEEDEGEIEQEKDEPVESPPEEEKKVEGVEITKETFEKISPETLPLTVNIEVGRIQMSLQKLLELQPGNLLELDVHPENGVDLVVNGKRVGKAELLTIGETLGIRILDI